MESTKRDYYFDNLKGFLIFTVVIGHIFENISSSVLRTHELVLVIYLFHMPLFTFISGYFAKRSRRSTQDKVKEMLKIYIIAQIVYTLFYKFVINSQYAEFKLFYPNWTLWYLLSLTFWYIISDYIKDAKKWLIASILFSILIGLDKSVGGFLSISRTIFFLPFFIAGYAMDKSWIDKLRQHRVPILLASAIIIAITCVFQDVIPVDALYEYSDYNWIFESNLTGIGLRAFHYVAAFITGAGIMAIWPQKKVFWAFWGRNSLVVYLIHSAVIKVVSDFGIVKVGNTLDACIFTAVVLLIVHLITWSYVKIKSKFIEKKVSVAKEV